MIFNIKEATQSSFRIAITNAKVFRFKEELRQLILNNSMSKKDNNKINKKISDGRAKLIKLYGHAFNENGSKVPQFDKVHTEVYKHYRLKEYRHYGGTLIKFRNNYKTAKKNKLALIKQHLRSWPIVVSIPLDNFIKLFNGLQKESIGDGAKADMVDDFISVVKVSYPKFKDLQDDYLKQFAEKT